MAARDRLALCIFAFSVASATQITNRAAVGQLADTHTKFDRALTAKGSKPSPTPAPPSPTPAPPSPTPGRPSPTPTLGETATCWHCKKNNMPAACIGTLSDFQKVYICTANTNGNCADVKESCCGVCADGAASHDDANTIWAPSGGKASNCGTAYPVPDNTPCHTVAPTVAPTTAADPNPSPSPSTPSITGPKPKLAGGAIAGIVIGVLVVLAVVLLLVRRSRRDDTKHERSSSSLLSSSPDDSYIQMTDTGAPPYTHSSLSSDYNSDPAMPPSPRNRTGSGIHTDMQTAEVVAGSGTAKGGAATAAECSATVSASSTSAPASALAVAVRPAALGTRHEGFACDFCGKPLGAMNTLFTDEWTIDELRDLGEQAQAEIAEQEKRNAMGDGAGDAAQQRHEGVRLCGECSVGHCPECGTQLVPHLPANQQQQGRGRQGQGGGGRPVAAGLQTVLWYTSVGKSDVIVRCPNGDYETTMKMGGASAGEEVGSGGAASASSASSGTVQKGGSGKGKLTFSTSLDEST